MLNIQAASVITVKEIAEKWYETRRITIDWEGLSRFLNNDVWNCGTLPTDLLRTLCIVIGYYDIVCSEEFSTVSSTLQSLSALKSGVSIVICITFHDYGAGFEPFKDHQALNPIFSPRLDGIFTQVKQLEANGLKLIVYPGHNHPWHVKGTLPWFSGLAISADEWVDRARTAYGAMCGQVVEAVKRNGGIHTEFSETDRKSHNIVTFGPYV